MRLWLHRCFRLALAGTLSISSTLPTCRPIRAFSTFPISPVISDSRFNETALGEPELVTFLHGQPLLAQSPQHELVEQVAQAAGRLDESSPRSMAHRSESSYDEFLLWGGEVRPFRSLMLMGLKSVAIFMPLFSLRSRRSQGIGDTRDMGLFAQFLAQWGYSGGHQILSPGPKSFLHPSPYLPISRNGIWEIYLPVDQLPETLLMPESKALWEEAVADGTVDRLNASEHVDYEAVWNFKRRFLDANGPSLFLYEGDNPVLQQRRRDLEAFVAREGADLEDYSLFCALKERFGWNTEWKDWPPEIRDPAPSTIQSLKDDPIIRRAMQSYQYGQFAIRHEWDQVHRYYTWLGLPLTADFPMNVSADSADGWAHPDWFDLTQIVGFWPEKGFPLGQLWDAHPLNWDRMRELSYKPALAAFEAATKLVDCLRINNYLGFWIYHSVPVYPSSVIEEAQRRTVPPTAERIIEALQTLSSTDPEIVVPSREEWESLDPSAQKSRLDSVMLRYQPLIDVLRGHFKLLLDQPVQIDDAGFGADFVAASALIPPAETPLTSQEWAAADDVTRRKRLDSFLVIVKTLSVRKALATIATALNPILQREHLELNSWAQHKSDIWEDRRMHYLHWLPNYWQWVLLMSEEERIRLLQHLEADNWKEGPGDEFMQQVTQIIRDRTAFLLLRDEKNDLLPGTQGQSAKYGIPELLIAYLNSSSVGLYRDSRADPPYGRYKALGSSSHDMAPINEAWKKDPGSAWILANNLLHHGNRQWMDMVQNYPIFTRNLHDLFLEDFMHSEPFLLFLTLQDLLMIEGRINIPGEKDPRKVWNWVGPLLEDLVRRDESNPFYTLLAKTEEFMHQARRHGHDPPRDRPRPEKRFVFPHPEMRQVRELGVGDPKDPFDIYAVINPIGRPLEDLVVEAKVDEPNRPPYFAKPHRLEYLATHSSGFHLFGGKLSVPYLGESSFSIGIGNPSEPPIFSPYPYFPGEPHRGPLFGIARRSS